MKLPLFKKFKYYVNVKTTEEKLRDMLSSFRFSTLSETIQEVDNWPATFSAVMGDKSGWRNFVVVETRGGFGKKYSKQIKALVKSIKLKALK